MPNYPLVFTYNGTIQGGSFAADIVARGRALMVSEGDGWWMYGVNPGPIADGGASPAEANAKFRRTFWVTMKELAEEATDFDTFRASATEFFQQSDPKTEAEWRAAVAQVRSGAVDAPLPRVNGDAPGVRLDIVKTEKPVARELTLDDQPQLAA